MIIYSSTVSTLGQINAVCLNRVKILNYNWLLGINIVPQLLV